MFSVFVKKKTRRRGLVGPSGRRCGRDRHFRVHAYLYTRTECRPPSQTRAHAHVRPDRTVGQPQQLGGKSYTQSMYSRCPSVRWSVRPPPPTPSRRDHPLTTTTGRSNARVITIGCPSRTRPPACGTCAAVTHTQRHIIIILYTHTARRPPARPPGEPACTSCAAARHTAAETRVQQISVF